MRHIMFCHSNHAEVVEVSFQLGDDLRRHRAPRFRLVLVAIELVRVVACGDDGRPGRLALDDGPRSDLRWRWPVEDETLDAVAREYLRHGVREVLRGNPAVVADDRERIVGAGLLVLRRGL